MGQRTLETSYAFKNCQRVATNSTAATLSTITSDYITTYRIVSSVDTWATWGSSTVVAGSSVANTSKFLPAFIPEYINTNGRYFSFINEGSTSAFVNVCEATQGD